MIKAKTRALIGALILAALALAAFAQAETVQKGQVRVSFEGKLTPTKLPRTGLSPVKVSVAAKIAPTNAEAKAPQLTRMSIAINRYGVLDSTGLPTCELDDIQPSTTGDALAVCRKSLVGEGSFTANVPESGRSPFPANGKLYAFSGAVEGKPAILAHVYGVRPAPTSFTLAFILTRSKGRFGTTLTVDLPKATNGGYITGISLDLFKKYSYHGKQYSFASASCPAPKGVHVAGFPFAKASFSFVGLKPVTSTLSRSCSVRGK